MSQFDLLFKTDTKSKAGTKQAAKPESKTAKKKPLASLSINRDKTLSPPVKTSSAEKLEKRASGKSSNADYTQVLTYIKRNTHRQVKKSLFDDPQNRDLSELVEELLADWLKKIS